MPDRPTAINPARTYSLLVGVALTALGVVGFFIEAGFDVGDTAPRAELGGFLDVNGWINAVHALTGLLGIGAAINGAERPFALAIGWVYLLLGILGFVAGDASTVYDLFAVDTEGNLIHLALGLLGIGAAWATTPPGPPAVPA